MNWSSVFIDIQQWMADSNHISKNIQSLQINIGIG